MLKRRFGLLLAAAGVMIVIAAVGSKKKDGLLVLEWAAKAAPETPPTALLIDLGLKDDKPTNWSGRATVTGAKVVHREGHRFQDKEKDKLIDPDSWEASSHRPLRLPPKNPALAKTEGIVPVGIVLHLSDIKLDATLTLTVSEGQHDKVTVPLKEVLAGQTKHVWDGAAAVRLVSTATPITSGKAENDFPAAAYGPDGTLWVAYIGYTLKDEKRRIEAENLTKQPENFKAYDTPDFGDQLFVKYYKGGKWSEPIAITDGKQDLVRCAIAVESDGIVWVVYSAHREGRHDTYARPISKKFNPDKGANAEPRPGREENFTGLKPNPTPLGHDGRTLSPVMCTSQDGQVRIGVQSSFSKLFDTTIISPNLATGELNSHSFSGFNHHWGHALAAGPNGETAVAHDEYHQGDYDVKLSVLTKGIQESKDFDIATSARFEARPSICYDPEGRLWIAYEEGPEQWGKDFGALDQRGNPLYFSRTVKVVCLQDGKLMAPVAELPPLVKRPESPDTGMKVEGLPRLSSPQIGIDGKGRVWVTYRQKFGTRYSTHPGSYWITFARRLDGDKWSEPIEIDHSDGMLDNRPVLLPHANGGLRILHSSDGRHTTPEKVQHQVYMSYLDLPGDPVEPKLVLHEPGKKDDTAAKKEAADVKRIREYRIEAGMKKYQLLRGEFHRHTEISWDGGPDGSLEDMFRYAIDAADMDWIGNGDHDNGGGREYTWWLTQKLTDAYHVKDRFTPVFSYERSVQYPHGHRNCVFARRGIRTLPRLAEPDPDKKVGGIHADDTKMLYRYLHEFGGICASHTSATSMGTDWRDNDPEVEPIVEIYQGDRMSYEKEGAPRAGYDPKSDKKPANIAGWFPKGFINLALEEKGYKLGFQSSSDHFSTHISFCIVLAERHDREAIVDALRKRHCYGATDNIVLDVRSGGHVMGDEFKTADVPTLQITVKGTEPLTKVEVLRDSEVVKTFEPGKAEFADKWTDPKADAGKHYYYVRVQQADGALAWASPMWIESAK